MKSSTKASTNYSSLCVFISRISQSTIKTSFEIFCLSEPTKLSIPKWLLQLFFFLSIFRPFCRICSLECLSQSTTTESYKKKSKKSSPTNTWSW